jgi:hypothetical protein
MLLKVLRATPKCIRFRSEAATPRSFLRSATECIAMHYTGHGMPGTLLMYVYMCIYVCVYAYAYCT